MAVTGDPNSAFRMVSSLLGTSKIDYNLTAFVGVNCALFRVARPLCT
jgi:hypothetical protein